MPGGPEGWLALTDYIDADGNVDQVCIARPGRRMIGNTISNGQCKKGDHHGQAPTLWCAVALLRAGDAAWRSCLFVAKDKKSRERRFECHLRAAWLESLP